MKEAFDLFKKSLNKTLIDPLQIFEKLTVG